MKKLITIIMLMCMTPSSAEPELIEVDPTIAVYTIPINILLLGAMSIDGVSADDPPQAPSSCLKIIEGVPHTCWCYDIDQFTACVPQ